MEYQTICKIKESEKATVELAAVELFVGPVIVKRLKGGKPEIYRLLAMQNNPHIPQIYAVEEKEDELLVAEEYVDGESLGEHLQNNLLSDEKKIELALQLCEAVGFLHALSPSIIHRDIKPSNILINGKGELKLIDFDASRQYKETPSSSDTRLLGTVEYAPPEQFGYSQTDVRSDIYSMGIVFHEMKLSENKKQTEKWEKIVEKCTSFDPKNRYQNVWELAEDIRKLQSRKSIRWIKSAIFCVVAAVMLFAIGFAGWYLGNSKVQETGGTGASLTEAPVSTDAPTLTPTPEPTATATPMPEPTATLTPEPTATATATPEPTATATPTPEPTATATLEPTPMPAPELEITSIPVPTQINARYYKGLAEETELIFHYGSDVFQLPDMWDVECYDYATGKTHIIPMKDVEVGPGYIRLLDNGLLQLEPSVYLFTINMYYGVTAWRNTTERIVQIYGESECPEEQLKPMSQSINYFYFDDPHNLVKEVTSFATSKFVGVQAKIIGEEAFDVPTEWYDILCGGKVLVLKKEFLLQYFEAEQNIFLRFYFDDGKQQDESVCFVEHSPWLNKQ